MPAAAVILMLLTSLGATLGNTMLKAGATASRQSEAQMLEWRHLPQTLLRPLILGGIVVYGASQLFWITVLRVVDLSLAYPLQIGLNFTLIMLIAWIHFHEPVSPGKLFGVALIFAGILVVALG